ncbi:MAG: F0F1 ATP synthase subunit alpha, partial [Planctomycetes bacterium]|nr:F0F1 ATP synthase subunit alpha [Planctomycetota bacterium]
ISVSRVGSSAQTKAMKQVAGRLRLDLAQYRELAAFAQFGSDLDAATLAQLRRGERMVEVLKQDQYVPMALSHQVMLIFAGTEGHLDDVDAAQIRRFEAEFLAFMDKERPQVGHTIETEKVLSDDTRKALTEAIQAFKKRFKKT